MRNPNQIIRRACQAKDGDISARMHVRYSLVNGRRLANRSGLKSFNGTLFDHLVRAGERAEDRLAMSALLPLFSA
jgi:hypothetical protein